jgi:hypothetical protein
METFMRRSLVPLLACVVASGATTLPATKAHGDGLIGRWDLTVRTPEGDRPSWFEIRKSGNTALVGQFVGIVGSARPVSRVDVRGDSMRFAVPPQWESGANDMVVEGRLDNERMQGWMTFPDGTRREWTAVRAPAMRKAKVIAWAAPIRLFNGRDLAGWHAVGGENQWIAANGLLRSPKSGSNIVTDRKFGDFKLHIEFRYPKDGNSGVYLRGRHEVQIEDNFGSAPASNKFGGVYGFLTPSEMVARPAGQWQSFDITVIGRMVTVVANGITVISNQEIPGPTGGALDSDEGSPGPIMLQGDHAPVEYRNIVLTPAK